MNPNLLKKVDSLSGDAQRTGVWGRAPHQPGWLPYLFHELNEIDKRLTDSVYIDHWKAKKCFFYPQILVKSQYLWEQMEKVSAKRMKSAFPDWLPKYKGCPPHLKHQLEQMSASTLKRYLKEVRLTSVPSKGLSTNLQLVTWKTKFPLIHWTQK